MPKPNVTIVRISRNKISDEQGIDRSNITFMFDMDVYEYTVRCTGTSPFTGILADLGTKSVSTQAKMTVLEMASQTVKNVSSFSANTEITAIVDYTELYGEGGNRINIYGLSRDAPQEWTPYNQT
jgi:hypothetical protein